jgi:hypothetical protein
VTSAACICGCCLRRLGVLTVSRLWRA